MTINFAQLQAYLDAIANGASGDITVSPHGSFWNVPYATFKAGNIPQVTCPRQGGQPIPNLNAADLPQSAFSLILRNAAGFCAIKQMPAGGPFLTDQGTTVKLADGTVVTGVKILADIQDWLEKGAPEL